MSVTFDKKDDSVVVVIGTGPGGGVVASELAQKGVKVVALEAGGRHGPEDFVNDEWGSFVQISWLDSRSTSGSWRVANDFSGLPTWLVKGVGGSEPALGRCIITFSRARMGAYNLWQCDRCKSVGLAN